MPVQINGERFASKRQVAFLFELLSERVVPADAKTRLIDLLNRHQDTEDPYELPFRQARDSIEWLLQQNMKPGIVPDRIGAMPKRELGPSKNQEFKRRLEARNQTPATRAVQRDPATLLTSGVFRLNDETYIIVPTRSGKHVAKRWVETPPRLNSHGETVRFDWVHAPGVIWALEEEHRLPVADIEAMLIEHRVCIYPGCGIRLRAANSVAAGAGKRHAERLGIPWKKRDRERTSA